MRTACQLIVIGLLIVWRFGWNGAHGNIVLEREICIVVLIDDSIECDGWIWSNGVDKNFDFISSSFIYTRIVIWYLVGWSMTILWVQCKLGSAENLKVIISLLANKSVLIFSFWNRAFPHRKPVFRRPQWPLTVASSISFSPHPLHLF